MTHVTSTRTPSRLEPPVSTAWDRALAELVEIPPLLQSWGWGEVQRRAGWEVERIELPGGGRASVQVRGGRARLGYVPRGPVPVQAETLQALVEWARARPLARLRVEPEAGPELDPALRELGFHPRPDASPQQPGHTA